MGFEATQYVPAGSNPYGTPAQLSAASSPTSLEQTMYAQFPWLQSLGLPLSWFQNVSATTTNADEVVGQLRQTAQYKSRFVSITRPDGSMRTTEAGYLQTEQNYRQLLKQHGYDKDYMTPQSLSAFFDSDIDPNELSGRLDTYTKIKQGSQSVKDAFYVYAGLRVTDDDLYNATVDETYGKQLQADYAMAAPNVDYATWLKRASEVASTHTDTLIAGLKEAGLLNPLQATGPNTQAWKEMFLDQLYHGGDPVNGEKLDLTTLVNSYADAVIGAAARGAGLEMPTLERVQAMRQAGIDATKATSAYMTYGMAKGSINASVQRARGVSFGQQDFENATMLGNAAAASNLAAGQAYDQASGQQWGSFQFGQSPSGRFTQKGFKSPI